MITKRNPWAVLLGVVLGGLALLLYSVTLCRGPFPGESATLMAAQLGLSPQGNTGHLLWRWCASLMGHLPLGTLSYRFNLFSAFCGAGSVTLFVILMVRAVWLVIPVTDLNEKAAQRAALAAGLVGGVTLAGCIPFWYAATRFHPATFDLLLLMVLANLFTGFAQNPRVRSGVLLMFLYGACASEFATLIVFAPLLLIGLLYTLWSHGLLRWGRVLLLAAGLVLGLLLYLPAARDLQLAPSFEAGRLEGFWVALYTVIKLQYQLIARSLPQIGWLLVILVGIVPWLAVLIVARRGLNEERDWGLYLLHGILTLVVGAVLFNVPFAPWSLLGTARLLVTPYVLLAFTFGYLAAYWYLLPRVFRYEASEEESSPGWFREHGGVIPVTAMLGVALLAGWLNLVVADGRPAGAVNAYAAAVVSASADCDWLITDGALDGNIQVLASEQGRRLNCLNLQQGSNVQYMRCLARSFQEVRLRSLAEVDGYAFLREWMTIDTNFSGHVGSLVLADLWLAGSLQPIPDVAVIRGARSMEGWDPAAAWSHCEEFWKRPFLAQLREVRSGRSMMAGYGSYALRNLSLLANNTGVLLEDAGWKAQAFAAYGQARQLDTNNISALLNQLTMVQNGYACPEAERVKSDFTDLSKSLTQKLQIWSLSRVYGYVRMPEAYAGLGMTWAFSGQPGLAVAGYRRAIELAPDRKDQLSQGLAMAYLAQDQQEGDTLLRELLAKDPANPSLLLSMARQEIRRSRFAEGASLLERALKAGVDKDRIAMEYAVIHLTAGEPAKARVILQELVDLHPDMTQAWSLLAATLIQQNDTKGLDECERKLSRVKGQDFITTVVLAEIALRKARFTEARTFMDQALALHPSTPVLLDMLLRLDVTEGRRDLAATHIRALLLLDAGHPFANQVLASMQLERKEYSQAENSLRKSLERKHEASVVNDLAWVLAEKGELGEAETRAREALAMNDRLGTAWDTLAVILMKHGQLQEAGAALQKAVALDADNAPIQVHLAQYYEKSGNLAKASELADMLLAHPVGLSLADQEELRRIGRRGHH